MAQQRASQGRSAKSFLVLSIIWGIIFVISLSMDITHKATLHSPWHLLWDFIVTPAFCIGNLVGYFKRRPNQS